MVKCWHSIASNRTGITTIVACSFRNCNLNLWFGVNIYIYISSVEYGLPWVGGSHFKQCMVSIDLEYTIPMLQTKFDTGLGFEPFVRMRIAMLSTCVWRVNWVGLHDIIQPIYLTWWQLRGITAPQGNNQFGILQM